MEDKLLVNAVSDYLGFPLVYQDDSGLYHVPSPSPALNLSICFSARSEQEYLQSFEKGIQRLIAARAHDANIGLSLVLDGHAMDQRNIPSYRAGLKKYSNSIIFMDLQISLLLVGPKRIAEISPNGVNDYLRNLDENLRHS